MVTIYYFMEDIEVTSIQFHALAKTELHCHLDGSLAMSTIRQLAKMAAISLPQDDQELKAKISAAPECDDLMDYLKTFDFVRPLLQTKEALTLAAYDVARQAAKENVLYIEIRFAPELSMDEGLSVIDTIEAVLKGLQKAEAEFGITARAIACGMRQSPIEITKDIFEQLARLAPKGFVGFDFAGDEHGYPPQKLRELIEYLKTLGYPMTFHAGECGCPQHIADSINYGIKRLGHVTAINDQPDLIDLFVKEEVTAELCLTSNLQTKAAKTLADFPYLALDKAGARLSINTGNRTVSDTTLTREYRLFHEYFGVGVADFLRYNQMALDAAFIDQELREKLKAQLLEKYQPFLK
ncbi:adenosine deaminase [Streptococcus sp. zg-JUN1979]|uniref:adenosine deaminase n=1 Tax=Streptococcus sp. zg-JUN1979 TaxID=3391450 RepID=UPI0039A7616B